ncbi:uncharacterized protein A4U43_C04F22960 [Asparagus officinalis]|uniref:Glucose-methanol-choline oxidoreductase N-terminal domain-containing protein n=1 Tax=Asparagus officinalis TaxID=4686 RepID=A0A5P1F330_ASPOF|nr:uncharacterized protein A4U43_C04F22960 [Asparagus officinalis]
MYEYNGLLASDDTGVVILTASTVGGGSAINWAASIRTPDHVISEWRNECGVELFGSDAYAQALDCVCERMGVQNEVDEDNLNNSVLRRGCQELGYPVKNNGVVLPGCTATKILYSDMKRKRNVATGVAFEYENGWSGKKETCIVESKVTVVACGALRTPVLLKNSGLKNPNIGKNLHLHPVVMVWGHFPTENKNSYEGGIMTAMSPVVYKSAASGYGAIIQTPHLHPGMFSALTPWTSSLDFKNRMTKFANTAHIFALARDKSCGSIDSSGSITYKMNGFDEENLKRGIEKMLRIVTAAGAKGRRR